MAQKASNVKKSNFGRKNKVAQIAYPAEATYEDGVLNVKLPKSEDAKKTAEIQHVSVKWASYCMA